MNKRKSAGFTVDDALWRKFKSKAADEGLPIGEMLVRFIKEYLEEKDFVEPVKRKEGEHRKSVVRRRLVTGKKKPRRTLETTASVPESLTQYASRFSIRDPDEDSLREKVLDAIAEEYGLHAEDEAWLAGNLEMLEWHNRGGV